jgi:hypothetical protein
MKTWQKVLVTAFAVYVGLALTVAAWIGLWVVRAGWTSVHIVSPDTSPVTIHVVVPMALAEAGVSIAGHTPAAVQMRADLHDVRDLLPALETLARGLEEIPDGVLVDVRQGADHVVVRKVSGYFCIDVGSADGDRVRVQAPDQSLRRVLERLRRIATVES